MGDNCVVCKKKVFAMEKKFIAGKTYHQTCFKCKSCGTTLREKFDDHGGEVYCNRCYMDKFVDEDTKAEVAHMENAYARKQTNMTAKAILPTPGGAKGPPRPPASSGPPPPARAPAPPVSPRGPPAPPRPGASPASPPSAPMRTLPPNLSAAIKKAAGTTR
eukprot:Phypoly_transcript_22694.p1 GENE.Phypoly_transcript_22694~~Phypoly_transcript_22694.p1  ORF type:complete len:182 (+),score=42.42 Phypoly_transcript_22694:65-547(+)